MTDARLRLFWHRAGPLAAVAALVAAGEASQGCGGSSGTGGTGTGASSSASGTASGGSGTSSSSKAATTAATTSTTAATTAATTSSSTGGGGMGTGGEPNLTPALAANQASPFDATPDPAGTKLYFTGLSNTGTLAGVYTAPADGSVMTPTAVLAGAPYVSPWGISTSTDGTKLYVADPGADITLDANGNQIAGGSDSGVIFVQLVSGGAPTPLMGSAGFDPRGVEVIAQGGSDVVYFTGRNPTTGKVGVYTLPAAGAATPATVLEGAPLVEPSGVAIAGDGTVYVADATGPGQQGQVVSIAKAATTGTQVLGGIRIGYPAGIALSLDGTLLVSALDPVKASDVILELDPTQTTPTVTQITMNITANFEAAGLHRARTADVVAFADGTAGAVGPSGTTAAVLGGAVYTVK